MLCACEGKMVSDMLNQFLKRVRETNIVTALGLAPGGENYLVAKSLGLDSYLDGLEAQL